MDFYFVTKILLLILFELKEIFPTQAISLENDITKPLDKWLSSIFAFKLDQNESYNMLDHMMAQKDHFKNFRYNSKHASNFTIRRLSWTIQRAEFSHEFKFFSNEAQLLWKQMTINVWGDFQVENNTRKIAFDAYLNITNACFTCNFPELVSSSSEETNSMTIPHKFSYSNIKTNFEAKDWDYSHAEASDMEKKEMKREMFPFLLHECFNKNPNYLSSLNKIFQPLIQQKIETLSEYPDLLNNPEKFYYLIPKSSFLRFTLKRIVINGLSNLNTFKIRESNDIFTHTLHIKNIGGSMTLDYGSQDEAPFKMNFKIDHLFVMRKEETNCVFVQAKYWQITRAKENTALNRRQSEVMINGLESAIASHIPPSMKVGNVCGVETIPVDNQITNTSDWKTIKKSYKGYIPFNDDVEDEISAKSPFDFFNQ